MTASYAFGASSAGYSEYFIPGDEDSLNFILDEILADCADPDIIGDPTHSIITVTAWSDNTIVYYDHWEDGYDFKPDSSPTSPAPRRMRP